jgi:hypothetical protein
MLRAIVSQSPQPAIRQAFADPDPDLGGGHHRGAERTTRAATRSLRQGYVAFASAGADHGSRRLRPSAGPHVTTP